MMDINKRSPASWTELLIILVACIAPSLIPALPGTPSIEGPTSESIQGLITSAIQALSQTALLSLIIGARGKFREFGLSKPRARDLARSVGVFAVFLLAGVIASLISTWTGGMPARAGLSSPAALDTATRIGYIAVCAGFALAIGYREELLYRRFLIGALLEMKTSQVVAVVASTLLFSLGHTYQGAAGIAGSAIAGSILGILAIRGFGLHPLAWGHAAYDLLVLLTRL